MMRRILRLGVVGALVAIVMGLSASPAMAQTLPSTNPWDYVQPQVSGQGSITSNTLDTPIGPIGIDYGYLYGYDIGTGTHDSNSISGNNGFTLGGSAQGPVGVYATGGAQVTLPKF